MKLSTLTDRRAAHDPHDPAVSDARHTPTNAQLHDRIWATAQHLCDVGISVGDVVAAQLRNRVEFVVLLFGGLAVGCRGHAGQPEPHSTMRSIASSPTLGRDCW